MLKAIHTFGALLLLLLGLFFPNQVAAQGTQVVDKIVAVVDETVILQSEVQYQVQYLKQNEQRDDGTLYCRVLENMIMDKMLLSKAKLDSVEISEDQVDAELSRRIEMMARRVGGAEALEEQLGTSIVELRVEQRPQIREQLLIDQQKQKIFSNINVTPKEVQDFFNQIPKDSLPYLPAEVEISQIILIPKPSEQSKNKTRERLAEVLAEILSGEISFSAAAEKYSQDPGSRKQGGFLGEMNREDFVPEFAEVVFNMEEGQISEVFETRFGFHIAKLHKRVGQQATVSHVLLKAPVDSEDEEETLQQLRELRQQIKDGEISFAIAARENSEDVRTKDNGGMVEDPVSGSYQIPLDQLDADLYLQIDQMKPGEISEPHDMIYQGMQLVKAYRIIWLRDQHLPHRASLESDYQKFYQAAKQAKQAEKLQRWLANARDQIYIELREPACEQALADWLVE